MSQPGDASVLQLGTTSQPDLLPGEVLLAVHAAGVNRADILQRRGLYPPPPGASTILGLECAGTVIATSPDVSHPVPGDRVMALLPGGGYAERVTVAASSTMPIPAQWSFVEGAATPEVFLTAYLNMFQLGRLTPGASVLVHGGSGGVGTAAIQLARAAGARIAVTAGGPDRCRRCEKLGADLAIDYREQDFVAEIQAFTKGNGVDVVVDCIGAKYLGQNLECLATGRRLVVIGRMGGSTAELDLGLVMGKRLEIIGSTLRSRPIADKANIVRGFLEDFGDALIDGRIRPLVDRVESLTNAAAAHRALEAGEIFGKVVLTVDPATRSR